MKFELARRAPWSLLAGTLVLILAQSAVFAQTVQTNVPRLKDVFANDFTIGCLLSYPHVGFADDPPVPGASTPISVNGGTLIRFHMNSMSPGNNMKPQYTVDVAGSASAYAAASAGAAKDSVDVHPIVRFNPNLIAQLNWAVRQGFTFRGHTLVWHNQTPGTAFFRTGYTDAGARLTKEQMTERMRNYIRSVIRILHESWPGLLSAMDVVNEAVDDGGVIRTTNEWYQTFGDASFVASAFEIARQATVEFGETQMKLYYNDYNTHVAAKADGIVALVTPIFQAGYLDGIGMQDHDQSTTPSAAAWIASYNKFAPVCSEMAVTELDVNPNATTITPQVLQTQANQYAMLMKCFVERSARSGRGKIVNVSKDGLNDQYAFVANASLWDNQYQCKPAFYAVADVGRYYHLLDSLVAVADSLTSTGYTPSSWMIFDATRGYARTARDQNYSASVSAATSLKTAFDSLAIVYAALIPTSVAGDIGQLPQELTLHPNHPNPFNPTTQIRYTVPISGTVTLSVYTMLGQEVARLFEGHREAGTYVATFDAAGLPSGIYIGLLRSGRAVETRRMVLVR